MLMAREGSARAACTSPMASRPGFALHAYQMAQKQCPSSCKVLQMTKNNVTWLRHELLEGWRKPVRCS